MVALRRAAEDVQAIADLQLLQLAEMVVELGKGVLGAVVRGDAAVAIEPEAACGREDLAA